jgi:hypothetical protein
MPWAGGSYTKGNSGTGGWSGDASLGIGIEAGRHDTQDNDFATGINQCINKDGSNSFTGNANLGGFRPTNLAAGTAAAPALCVGNDVNTGVFGPAADTWAVATNGSERLRVDSNGRVGIGTTSPTLPLQVERAANDTDTRIAVRNTSNGSSAVTYITIGNDTSSTAGIIALNSNANTTGPGGDGLTIGTQTSSNFTLRTNNTERVRITSAGEVLVGGTTDNGAYNLQCNGTGVWGAGAYVNGSDERIKEEIAPIGDCLEAVAQLNPVTFKYKETWTADRNVQSGFIAQELQSAFADKNYLEGLVNTEGPYLSVAYQNLIPVLTKAIQELNTKVEALEARVAELEA